jgi:hypothetical protein
MRPESPDRRRQNQRDQEDVTRPLEFDPAARLVVLRGEIATRLIGRQAQASTRRAASAAGRSGALFSVSPNVADP